MLFSIIITMKKVIIMALAASVLVSGCQNPSKQTVGTVGGGLIGGLLGSQFGKGKGQIVGAIAGTLIGAGIGGAIGQSMDEQDKQAAAQAAQRALESGRSGQSVGWNNPDNGHSGTFTPGPPTQMNGQPCREFYHNVCIGGRKEQVRGTACRDAAGDWKIVN